MNYVRTLASVFGSCTRRREITEYWRIAQRRREPKRQG